MQVLINGESASFYTPLTVAALVAHYQLDPRKVAIEKNREIIARSAYGSTSLTEGDAVEIVEFIGGG